MSTLPCSCHSLGPSPLLEEACNENKELQTIQEVLECSNTLDGSSLDSNILENHASVGYAKHRRYSYWHLFKSNASAGRMMHLRLLLSHGDGMVPASRPGNTFQASRQGGFINRQRVVAHHLEPTSQP